MYQVLFWYTQAPFPWEACYLLSEPRERASHERNGAAVPPLVAARTNCRRRRRATLPLCDREKCGVGSSDKKVPAVVSMPGGRQCCAGYGGKWGADAAAAAVGAQWVYDRHQRVTVI